MFAKYAQIYIDQGISVFPARSNKKPAIPTWTPYQTRVPSDDEIKAWAKDLGAMNIAAVCGKLSNLTVVDCDTKEAVAEFEGVLPEQFEVPSSDTPKGGRHFYFQFAPVLVNKSRYRAGVDVRTEGGYVLLPPSRTKATQDKSCADGVYVRHNGFDIKGRPPLPDEACTYLLNGKPEAGNGGNGGAPPGQPILVQGTRDQDLFHLALQLFKDGHPREEVARIVLAAAKAATPQFPEREARAKVESAWKRMQKNGPAEEEEITLAERDASSVRIRPIPWVWPGVIPTHMAVAITGDAGQGKSLVAVDMAARISRGRPFPVYDKTNKTDKAPPACGSVIYVTSEGVLEMVLVPRLVAAGADLSKIKIIEGVFLKNGDFSIFDLTQHLPMLIERTRSLPDLVDLVVDPIVSFIPEKINTNQQNQVRQLMDRLSDLAYKLGIAVTPIMHFAKAPGGKAIHKTAGSGQFEAAVKMSWSVIRRPVDPRNMRLLVPQKTNINAAYQSLSFTIHPVNLPDPEDPKIIIPTAKIEYGNLIDEDPETLISPPIETDNHVTNAMKFLTRKLREGTTLYAITIIDEAEREGVPKWALYKAKDRMGVQHDKEGCFQGKTFWFLPKDKTP